ncbi:Metallo-hydrolase oxidoreductase [Fusarium acutatum]|uniref:Metallo-hydrolase oxidoreductase n=1 Tax=Fusarium acutatum TaxID=78861 RepID=A0A8H4JBG1_9HYPO|nr:Metallo-hydrolase oxidoreductase [Fusarium acutatum]
MSRETWPLLYETGAGKDYPEVWGPQLAYIFARGEHSEDLELDAAIKKTGRDIKDVKCVIIGHLHLDHAGLEYFRGTDVPIYVHEIELKNAFYSVATKVDIGMYTTEHPLHQTDILQKATGAKVILGHDRDALMRHKLAPEHYE